MSVFDNTEVTESLGVHVYMFVGVCGESRELYIHDCSIAGFASKS